MSLTFGTSGVRALVTDLTDQNVYWMTTAFLKYEATIKPGSDSIFTAMDLRESSPKILNAVHVAISDFGKKAIACYSVPTPCLAYYAQENASPAIMVTGSHIPSDRNGMKFYLTSGETLKDDDSKILSLYRELLSTNYKFELFDSYGSFIAQRKPNVCNAKEQCEAAFANRYLNFFGSNALDGLSIIFYEHSSVGRDILPSLLRSLGANVTTKGRCSNFIAVDTEALGSVELLAEWVKEAKADALVSTDGDADRPLVIDETGAPVPGDTLGMLACQYLNIEALALPISCNSSINELRGLQKICFTKIGSPFVIDELDKLARTFKRVAGFEANGGFILKSSLPGLKNLGTRDSVLPVLCALKKAKEGRRLSQIANEVNKRFTSNVLVRNCEPAMSQKILAAVVSNPVTIFNTIAQCSPTDLTINQLDGVRLTSRDFVVHVRPSGNAAEFRCYTEAPTKELALQLAVSAENFISNYIRENQT